MRAALAGLVAAVLGCSAAAAAPEQEALDLIKRGIAFRTVAGPDNQTFAYATFLKDRLVAGGFAATDVEVERLGDTAWLAARWRGTDPTRKPLYISAHMDVVEAKAADWERDPFVPVVENGYIYGRGATDMKFDLSLVVQAVTELRRKGFRPGRDIVLLFSGDEETAMKTTALLAERFHEAEYLLNADGGGGELDTNGRPLLYSIDGAEKTYADYELTITNPGGHSSAPRTSNAITEMSIALARIGGYHFPPEINELTRASMTAAAATAPEATAQALRRFLANPFDRTALGILRADPEWVGQLGTTCVATMVSAGHAPNALAQRATATVNCRIFPGTSFDQVQATLQRVAGQPKMTIRRLDDGSLESPASPMRADVLEAVRNAVRARYSDVQAVPAMSAGASDSMHFRARGVPSYGTSALFMQAKDHFSHGLNERTPVANIAPGIRHWTSLITALAK